MNLICQRPGFLNTIPGKVYKSNLSKTGVFEDNFWKVYKSNLSKTGVFKDNSWKSVKIESVKDRVSKTIPGKV